MRGRRTHTIAFVAHDFRPHESFSSHYLGSVLNTLVGELHRHGYYLLMFPLAIGDDLEPLKSLLRSGRLDGIAIRLVQDSPHTDPILQVIHDSKLPCVCIERPAADRFGFPTVTYDDAAGAFAATRHLIERGHRRIAHIHGDMRYATAQARLAGYERAMAEAGLQRDPAWVTGSLWSTREAHAQTHDLLDLPNPPTAIFAASDDLAFGAINAARDRDLVVPHDLAIVGFDDIRLAKEITPFLTTVRLPLSEMGTRAAEILCQRGQPGDPSAVETFPVELVQRSSS